MSPEKIVVGGIILTKGTKGAAAPAASAPGKKPKIAH
jgi:hypothetical protein